jgi:hypothetical protein
MTPSQTAELLTFCAAFDRRTIGKADVLAWHTVLADIDHEAAKQAVTQHYAVETRWIMPADIRGAVHRNRSAAADSIHGPGLPAEIPDADPDDIPAYLAAIRQQRTRAANGHELRPRPVRELLAGIGHGIPPGLEDVKRPGPLGDDCPKCHAAIGRPCRTPNGKERAPHPARNGETTDPETEAAEFERRRAAARDRLNRLTPQERNQLAEFQQELRTTEAM